MKMAMLTSLLVATSLISCNGSTAERECQPSLLDVSEVPRVELRILDSGRWYSGSSGALIAFVPPVSPLPSNSPEAEVVVVVPLGEAPDDETLVVEQVATNEQLIATGNRYMGGGISFDSSALTPGCWIVTWGGHEVAIDIE